MLNPPLDPQTQALKRLQEIMGNWQQYPGAAPGGTGPTGLAPGDATGWSNLMNQQTEAANLVNELQGKAPLTVKDKQTPSGALPSTMWDTGQTSAVTGQPFALPTAPTTQPVSTMGAFPGSDATTAVAVPAPWDQNRQRQALAGLISQRGQ